MSSARAGFTMYELVIYLALLSVWLMIVIPTVLNIVRTATAERWANEDITNLLYFEMRVGYLMRTQSVSVGTSTLQFFDGTSTTTIGVADLVAPVSDFSVAMATGTVTVNFNYKKQLYEQVYQY